MIQILPQHDPGKEIGQSLGSGFGDAMNLLGQRQLGISALDQLSNIDTKDMSPQQIMAEVGKATVGLPHLQKQAADMVQVLLQQKQAEAMREGLKRGAPGGPEVATDQQPLATPAATPQEASLSAGQPQPSVGQPLQPGAGDLATPGMRDVPQMQDQSGLGPLLNKEEIANIAEPFILTGDMSGMQTAISNAKDQKLKQRELQLQETAALREEQATKRALESELAQNVLRRTEGLLQSKGLPAGSPDEWKRLSYQYFQDERSKPENRDVSDEQIWSEAGRKLEQKVEDLAQAGDKHYRPTWRMNKDRRSKQAQDWTQQHLKAYGDNPEERALLKSIMMDNGWSREESTAIVQPMSKEESSALSSIPKGPAPLRPMSANQAAIQGIQRDEKVNEYINQIAPKLRDSLKPSDSLFLLKSKLVREKGLTDEDAQRVIDKMREPYTNAKGEEAQLQLQNHQVADLSLLQENTRPSLYDIIFGDRTVEILGPLIK